MSSTLPRRHRVLACDLDAAALGVLLVVLERTLPARARALVPSAAAFGLRMVVPGPSSSSIFLGASAAALLRRRAPRVAVRALLPVASGLRGRVPGRHRGGPGAGRVTPVARPARRAHRLPMATDPDRPDAPGPERTLRHDAEVDREHTTAVHPPPGPPGGAPVVGPGPEPRRDEGRDLRRQADAGVPEDPDRR